MPPWSVGRAEGGGPVELPARPEAVPDPGGVPGGRPPVQLGGRGPAPGKRVGITSP